MPAGTRASGYERSRLRYSYVVNSSRIPGCLKPWMCTKSAAAASKTQKLVQTPLSGKLLFPNCRVQRTGPQMPLSPKPNGCKHTGRRHSY